MMWFGCWEVFQFVWREGCWERRECVVKEVTYMCVVKEVFFFFGKIVVKEVTYMWL